MFALSSARLFDMWAAFFSKINATIWKFITTAMFDRIIYSSVQCIISRSFRDHFNCLETRANAMMILIKNTMTRWVEKISDSHITGASNAPTPPHSPV